MTCRLGQQKTARLTSAAIYLCFTAYMLLCHLPLPYCGDDATYLPSIGSQGLIEQFQYLYRFNGKIFTDYLAFLCYHIPYGLWKVLNTGVFLLVAILLVHLFTDKTPLAVLLTCVLVMTFPLEYLGTAGYIATCANYLYPLTGLLLISCQLKAVCAGQKVRFYRHLLLLPVMAYLLNQDQAGCFLVGGLLLLTVYVAFLAPKSKGVIACAATYFCVALAGYIILFFLPGHLNRMANPLEMELYLPEYATWSIGTKLYRGFTSTVAHIFFNDTVFSALFFFFLFIMSLQQKKLWYQVLAVLPLCGFLLINTVGQERFVHYNYIFRVLPELKALSTLGGLLGLGFSCFCLLSAAVTICKTCSPNSRWLLLSLLILGGGTRMLMGFSATIYASAHRTFTYLFFCLIAGCLVLLQELKNKRFPSAYYAGAAGIVMALLLK